MYYTVRLVYYYTGVTDLLVYTCCPGIFVFNKGIPLHCPKVWTVNYMVTLSSHNGSPAFGLTPSYPVK